MVEISTYAKGRLSFPSRIANNMGIKDGDLFTIDISGKEIIFKKIDKEDLKKLK